MKSDQNYKVSTDYQHLVELLRAGKLVVCFVTYDWNHGKKPTRMTTDVAIARYSEGETSHDYDGCMVTCCGVGFFEAYNYDLCYREAKTIDELFINLCRAEKLTYIEPTL